MKSMLAEVLLILQTLRKALQQTCWGVWVQKEGYFASLMQMRQWDLASSPTILWSCFELLELVYLALVHVVVVRGCMIVLPGMWLETELTWTGTRMQDFLSCVPWSVAFHGTKGQHIQVLKPQFKSEHHPQTVRILQPSHVGSQHQTWGISKWEPWRISGASGERYQGPNPGCGDLRASLSRLLAGYWCGPDEDRGDTQHLYWSLGRRHGVAVTTQTQTQTRTCV